MTVSLPVQASPPPASKAETASVRKRRRRAAGGGAADDCFTCSKTNAKCDRRRPYCSQCLEFGNECSGYKTQLTWGVGVASRGKLRGLSLPIAKAPPVKPEKKVSPARSRAEPAGHANSHWHARGDISPRTRREDIEMVPEHSTSLPTPFPGFHLSHVSQADIPPSISAPGWNIQFSTSMPGDPFRFQKMMPGVEHLSSSMDSLSDVDYMSPMNHAFSREEVPFVHSPTILYDNFTGQSSPVPQSPISAMMIEQRGAPTSCPSLIYAPSDHSSSLHSHTDNLDAQLSSKLLQDCESLGTPELDVYSTSAHSNGQFWGPTDEETSSHCGHDSILGGWSAMLDAQPLPPTPELVARIPFFLEYYEKTICPSMVFIDGPNNPFRDHILPLTGSSRSLQHAICALAACNLRMKRKLSLGQHGRDLADAPEEGHLDDQSLAEEYQHRNLAIHLLNEQLNDPSQSRHDSVLATILMLCHYRMAESGIAKFHTQFAGVKKILAMRRASPFPPSRDSAWMEALFTYFDAISASINDREAQLNTSFFGVMPDAQLLPLGAENLVGCDRDLFKTISKLGRLNLLSQHRHVQNLLSPASALSRGVASRSVSPLASPLASPLGHHQPYKPGHQHHLSADAYALPRFDMPSPGGGGGGGFATSPSAAPEGEDLLSPASAAAAAGAIPLCSGPPAYDDHRSTFWREWKDARIALQSWEFDPQRLLASLQGPTMATAAAAATGGQVRDLGSLSEAFRYAALLYTERLASPAVASAHNNFRNLVSQVVYYATSLEAGSAAEKFLLWPLFVAGSECVNELQQNIVRSKCREIMARSGYLNNLTALDVLERVWAGDMKPGGGPPTTPGMRRGPFNWTQCIGGPGVDMEWIMF